MIPSTRFCLTSLFFSITRYIYPFLWKLPVFWVVLIFTQASVICLLMQYSPESSSQYFECQDCERWSNEVPGQDRAPQLSLRQTPQAADHISSCWLNISWMWFLAPFSTHKIILCIINNQVYKYHSWSIRGGRCVLEDWIKPLAVKLKIACSASLEFYEESKAN